MSFSSCSRMWQCQTYCGVGDPRRELDRALVRQLEPGSNSGDLSRDGPELCPCGRSRWGRRARRVRCTVIACVGGVVGGDVERPSINDFEGHEVQVDRMSVGCRVDQRESSTAFDSRLGRDVGQATYAASRYGASSTLRFDRSACDRVEGFREVLHTCDGWRGQRRQAPAAAGWPPFSCCRRPGVPGQRGSSAAETASHAPPSGMAPWRCS